MKVQAVLPKVSSDDKHEIKEVKTTLNLYEKLAEQKKKRSKMRNWMTVYLALFCKLVAAQVHVPSSTEGMDTNRKW